MKFGQNLPRNQVPEWSDEYINYKGLKKLIKSAAEVSKNGGETDLTGFFYALDRNLEDVDGFYNKKHAEAARRLKLLRDRYGSVSDIQEGNRDEIEDLYGALLDLRSELRNLQWYGEVNRRGFIKITKKLDKKVAQSSRSQHRYIPFRVDPRPFASNKQLTKDLQEVNNWLSGLGEITVDDDASSTHSSISLSRGASKVIINLPRELLEDIDKAIRLDNVKLLTNSLSETQEYNNAQSIAGQRFYFNLLQRSISSQSRQCITYLLAKLPSLDEDDDINQRNCIHRLVISIGRTSQTMNGDQSPSGKLALATESSTITPAEAPKLQATQFAAKELEQKRPVKAQDPHAKLLAFVLDNLSQEQRIALNSRDAQGRVPLHYAAKYGVLVLCDILIDRMKAWAQFNVSDGFDSKYWFDEDKQTPLHLAVSGGHIQTTEALLNACRIDQGLDVSHQPQRLLDGSSKLLSSAVKANFVNIVGLLVAAGADVNARDSHAQGETPLHVAARYGHVDCAKVLHQGSKWCRLDVDVPEETFGWTPLTIAAVDGQAQMVQFFIDTGANLQATDVSGWTAKEHAALRGHVQIARLLNEHAPQTEPSHSNGQTTTSSIGERQSVNRDVQNGSKPSKPVKTFGHRYLTSESMVLISLGSMDQRKNINPVTLDNIPLNEAHATQLDTALSVVVSATGGHGEPTIVDLPVQETISTEPMAFYATDLSKVKIKFDIVPTYAGSRDQVVGRAIANLKTIRPDVGSKRMNLQGDIALPILSAKDLECIGEVHFNFLVITPFSHPNMSVSQNQTYWKRLETGPMVIGHRGLGKNMASRKSLQLGENTIQSFITAANLGASYVEFDVQLTKDHVPVIYHDFLVSETGIDAPVHSLTLEQFLHLQEETGYSPKGSQPSTPELGPQGGRAARGRANSMGVANDLRGDSLMAERMKHTADFKRKGFKGNLRGHSIQSPFTTLEEMLKRLPKNLGFNIEMKYPMLWETEEDSMDTYAVELNAFVDAVLRKIYDMGPGRDIIFSSFNPDVCLLLSFKQPNIPILFLTDAGCSPTGDIRATSLQEAIRFASRWNLLGIVSAAEPLVLCPRLVRVVKETGLVCVTYGVLNNDPANVKAQWREGIDAVIVDSVLAVRKGLTHEETQAAANGTSKTSVDQLAEELGTTQVTPQEVAAAT